MISVDASVDDLSGRTAIVTGAGKGLGRSYAIELASRGARVIVNNRVREGFADSAAAVVAEIQVAGGIAVASKESVESPNAGKHLVEQAMDEFGSVDILIANAGLDFPKTFHKQSWDEFESIYQINFQGSAQLLHAAWPQLLAAPSARVLVSTSSAGLYGNHGQSAYAASKAALIGLMRSLAVESENTGLRINAIAPYAVTPLTEPWFSKELAKVFTPQVVAKLVCYLASESCELHGQTIIAGGGGMRLAQVQETETVSPGETPEMSLSRLLSLSKELTHANASAQFQEFADSLMQQQ